MSAKTNKNNFTFTTDAVQHSWTDDTIESTAFLIPEELSEREQWITYALEEEDGKTVKKPHATETTEGDYGEYVKWAGVRSPDQFVDYMSAFEFVKEVNTDSSITTDLDGMGLVITEDDPYVAIDLDDCVDEQGHVKDFANKFLGSLDTFWEISQSGSGLHGIVKGELDDDYKNRNDELGIELYEDARFVAMTGNRVKGTAREIGEDTTNLQKLQHKYLDERDELDEVDFDLELSEESAAASDEEVVRTAKAYDEDFERLHNGSNHVDDNDGANESDLAYCNKLSFWTQGNAAQMERIWKNSPRARKKLDRDDYVRETIKKGLASNPDNFEGTYR